jgi:hypothetical protein
MPEVTGVVQNPPSVNNVETSQAGHELRVQNRAPLNQPVAVRRELTANFDCGLNGILVVVE